MFKPVLRLAQLAFAVTIASGVPVPAQAQRLPFERAFDLGEPAVLDVSTVRGAIEVSVGAPGRVVVTGAVTIRVDWNVPANAAELARAVAEQPPVDQMGRTVRLGVPADAATRRAVTVSYRVQVPSDTQVLVATESGATSVRGVRGSVSVRTHTAAIELTQLGGAVDVTTGSGSVKIDDVAGAVSVVTSSGSFVGRGLRSGLRVRTGSGSVDAILTASGDVDVETASSSISLQGVKGALTAVTKSGRISIQGTPGRPWQATSGSSGIELAIDSGAPFNVDAVSRSGAVSVGGAVVQGAVSKRSAVGSVGGGGPLVRASTRSGSIRIRTGGDVAIGVSRPRGRSHTMPVPASFAQ